jgi:peptidoglycan/LPS O-acetylase OafA/YrhL
MRGLAAIMILVVHYGQNFSENHVIMKVNPILEIGKYGVPLFFVLSAYLLTNTLKECLPSSSNFRNYLLRRLFRIFPAYYVCLASLVIITGASTWQVITHIFAIHTISNSTFGGINYPFWSISVEISFYILLPFMAWRFRQRESLLLYAMIFLGLSWQLVSGALRMQNGFDNSYDWSARMFLVTALPAFALGMYASFVQRNGKLAVMQKIIKLGVILSAFETIFRFCDVLLIELPAGLQLPRTAMHGSLGYLAFGSVGFILINHDYKKDFLKRVFLRGMIDFFARIGKISFSIYLWHLPIIQWSARQSLSLLEATFLAALAIGAISTVSYMLIERPCHLYAVKHFKIRR